MLPFLPKNKQQKENKQQKRSRLGAVLLVGDGGGCFQSISQSINHSISLLGKAEIVKRQMLKKKKKKRVLPLLGLSLSVAMSRDGLCL